MKDNYRDQFDNLTEKLEIFLAEVHKQTSTHMATDEWLLWKHSNSESPLGK